MILGIFSNIPTRLDILFTEMFIFLLMCRLLYAMHKRVHVSLGDTPDKSTQKRRNDSEQGKKSLFQESSEQSSSNTNPTRVKILYLEILHVCEENSFGSSNSTL